VFSLHDNIFALDIGTRSVVGIVLEKQKENYYVKDILSKEHTERAMLDGQIHDVLAVSKIIQEIKQDLEQIHGPLKQVCVAAAGRALKTERAEVSMDIKGKPMMQRDDILHMELSAVQQAQSLVAEKNKSETNYQYYCVGYSILYYRLDGQEIGNLIDQSGELASVEIIATFLPRVVVESLLAALNRADLVMKALTLEPIAAINVLIPQSMRRLNVALVDIGAGTSDIAITDAGTVIAYGMVPIAGDEITEAISDQLLLDFPLAEQAKRQLLENEEITVTDILGFESSISKDEIISQITPALSRLADAISSEILLLNNNKSPKAIMLVGGGSLTPELPVLLAEKLNLPANRVAIRGIEAIQNLAMAEHLKKGPELVTPVGIAIAAHNNPIQYVSVSVNGQLVRLFEMKKLTVGDSLLTAGVSLSKLYGKPGMAKIVKVNGQIITIPGSHGKKPLILLNGQASSLDDEISNDDKITVERGEDGTPSFARILDLLDHIPSKNVAVNGKRYTIEAIITKNGQRANKNDLVEDRDEIQCTWPDSIKSLLISLKLESLLPSLRPFIVEVNGKFVKMDEYSGKILKNGIVVKQEHSFEDSDEIVIERSANPKVLDFAAASQVQLTYSIHVTFNGRRIILSKDVTEIYRGDTKLKAHEVINNGDKLTFSQNNIDPFIFQDLFRHVEISKPTQSNGRFVLMRNNEETGFNETITTGDELKILWPTKMKKY
jgi:cell division protein FtsA